MFYFSYVKSEWQLTCPKGETNACNTPGFVDTFEVTSSVRFTLVPGNTPERLPRSVIGSLMLAPSFLKMRNFFKI